VSPAITNFGAALRNKILKQQKTQPKNKNKVE
jgi:hypothetical protein